MNKLIITLATALALGTTVLAEDCATNKVAEAKSATVEAVAKAACKQTTELTVRERKDAEKCGIPAEQWKTMTKKARREARQAAQAKALGMTVAEMKAANNKKVAEKAGCDPEKWAKMSVKERNAFRRAAKARAQAQASVKAE